jgi:hypothetical protein
MRRPPAAVDKPTAVVIERDGHALRAVGAGRRQSVLREQASERYNGAGLGIETGAAA